MLAFLAFGGMFFLFGCAAQHVKAKAPTSHVWSNCHVDDRYPVSVKPGDQQHFLCTLNESGREYEVSIRPKQ